MDVEQVKNGLRGDEMIDTGMFVAAIIATFGGATVWYYGWYERKTDKVMRRMLNAIAFLIVLAWVMMGVLYFA
jgi:hypothetical protein